MAKEKKLSTLDITDGRKVKLPSVDFGHLNPKQKVFCQARQRYVAYGGARGGGKSHVVRIKALGGALNYPNIRILIIRREYPELEQSMITQTALNGKAASIHTHAQSDITGLANALSGKSDSGHTHDDRYYTESEIDTALGGKAPSSHTHTKSQITDFPTSMTPTSHSHPQSDVTGLSDALSAKLPTSGGTMTGALTLSGAPTADLHAATKAYVDTAISTAIGSAIGGSY